MLASQTVHSFPRRCFVCRLLCARVSSSLNQKSHRHRHRQEVSKQNPSTPLLAIAKKAARMKKGFRLIARSMGSPSSPHRPCGIPPGFGYGMDSLTTADVHANDSPAIVRSMGSLSSPHCPRGIPPGFGYGMDSLVAADLHAIFSHGEIVNTDFKSASPPFDKVFPAVSLFQEKACLDHTSTQERKFMKLYEVKERSVRGKAIVQIHIIDKPNDGSPSAPIFCNPCEGVQSVLDSVFRTKLSMQDTYTVFTSWVACPPLGPQKAAVCYTSGLAFAKDCYGLHYNTEGLEFEWHGGSGCFGSLVKSKQLGHGFNIATRPLAVAYDSMEDVACFQAFAIDADFLLPCSPTEVLWDGFVASYGYPCVEHFLQQAQQELILKNDNHGVGELYKDLAVDSDSLYGLLKDTFGAFIEGQLLCSPGILLSYDGNFLHIKSSTLKGASGAPIIPAGLPGYTIGIHEGGTQADANRASSTDSPGFVDSYARYVLSHLPSPDDAIFLCRDLGPFKRWLKKHGLKWDHRRDVEQDFVTPPAKDSKRIAWSIKV